MDLIFTQYTRFLHYAFKSVARQVILRIVQHVSRLCNVDKGSLCTIYNPVLDTHYDTWAVLHSTLHTVGNNGSESCPVGTCDLRHTCMSPLNRLSFHSRLHCHPVYLSAPDILEFKKVYVCIMNKS